MTGEVKGVTKSEGAEERRGEGARVTEQIGWSVSLLVVYQQIGSIDSLSKYCIGGTKKMYTVKAKVGTGKARKRK